MRITFLSLAFLASLSCGHRKTATPARSNTHFEKSEVEAAIAALRAQGRNEQAERAEVDFGLRDAGARD